MGWGLSPRERYGLPEVKDPFSEDHDKSVIAKTGQDYGILYDTVRSVQVSCILWIYIRATRKVVFDGN